MIGGNEEEFVEERIDFGMSYFVTAPDAPRLFVDAFRNGRIPGL